MRGLRWRVVAVAAFGSTAALLMALAAVVATGNVLVPNPNGAAALIVGLALAQCIATLAALLGVRWAVGPTGRSVESLTSWARSFRRVADRPRLPPVDQDVGAAASAVSELANSLQDENAHLRSENGRLAIALDHMESGVILIDNAARIRLINPAAARLLRTTAERAEGRGLMDVARDHEIAAVARALLSSEYRDGKANEPTVVDLGRPARSVQVVGTQLPEAGRGRPGALLLLHDVTLLRQTDVMRREFVANVSHELRTPLAGLKALAETLEAGALDDPEAARGFLGRILLEVDRLTDLVRELLELAQLESGAPAIDRRRVDLVEVARRAQSRMAAQSRASGITLELDTDAEPKEVSGDEARLEAVYVNLLQNAINHTDPEGRVTIKIERAGDSVLSQVTDSGRGIPAEDLPRIFERFFKGDKARSSPGSGLGLAIVKHTVQVHGGQVWVESTEGEGSTFYVGLPAAT